MNFAQIIVEDIAKVLFDDFGIIASPSDISTERLEIDGMPWMEWAIGGGKKPWI